MVRPFEAGVTAADIFPLSHVNLWTDPIDAVSPSFFTGDTAVFYGQGRIIGAGGITVFIVTDFFEGALISGVVRDQCH